MGLHAGVLGRNIMPRMVKPLVLCILDGFGVAGFRGKRKAGDAIYQAVKRGQADFFKKLFLNEPHSLLTAIGRAAGLPPGVMGSSETNHQIIPAGRTIDQPLYLLGKALENKSFYENKAINAAIGHAARNNSTLHLMGILQRGKGTVHGSIDHLFPILEMAKRAGIKDIAIHLFTDGRDNDKRSAGETFLGVLESKIAELELQNVAKIRTVMGRSVAMSRDMEWDNILAAMQAIVAGEGAPGRMFGNAREAIEFAYSHKNETDEFIQPSIIGIYQGMQPQDAAIFWNYRDDRARELTTAFLEEETGPYNYKSIINPNLPKIAQETHAAIAKLRARVEGIFFANMTDPYIGAPSEVAFSAAGITPTLGEVVSNAGLQQLRVAGPEKFAHVTAWFSGKRAKPFNGESRFLAFDPTLKNRTNGGKSYDLVPEMTAPIEATEMQKALAEGIYDLIVHNYQNPDMVGHTGNLEAAISAVSFLSAKLEKTVEQVMSMGGVVVITADHGNADEMLVNKGGELVTSTKHSFNPVPLWILGRDVNLATHGRVASVGPTVLDLMGLTIPSQMTAPSLIV